MDKFCLNTSNVFSSVGFDVYKVLMMTQRYLKFF